MSTDTAGNEQNPRAFGPPFDDSDADVIFRSSDQVDFYLYKNILAKSSSVFRDMFSLSQPTTTPQIEGHDTSTTTPRRLPIIFLSETHIDLAIVLRFCYPLQFPTVGVQEIVMILHIAEKYAMDWLRERMGDLLVQTTMVQDSPIKVFGIAWAMKLEKTARAAAKECLRVQLALEELAASDDLDFISGPALRQLALYHRKCAAIVRGQCVEGGLSWLSTTNAEGKGWGWLGSAGGFCGCGHQTRTLCCNGQVIVVKDWWASYMREAASELDKRPWPPIVRSMELANAAYQRAQCAKCREAIPTILPDFIQTLMKHLETCLSQVSLDLPFSDKVEDD